MNQRFSLVLLVSLSCTGLRAHPFFCGYEAYRPAAINQYIRGTAGAEGIALLENQPPNGTLLLVRDSNLLGMLTFTEDIRAGTSDLQLADAMGKKIVEAKETTYPCPPENPLGRCHLTEVQTELDTLAPLAPPFSILLEPTGALHLMKYGKDVLPQDWRPLFGEMLGWITSILAHPTAVVPIVPTSDAQRIFLILASDNFLTPYVGRLSLARYGPYWVITGVVPSLAVYDSILADLQAHGIFAVQPNMIIDTRTQLPIAFKPDFGGCYE